MLPKPIVSGTSVPKQFFARSVDATDDVDMLDSDSDDNMSVDFTEP